MADSEIVRRKYQVNHNKGHNRIASNLFRSDLAGSYIKTEFREDQLHNNSTNEILDLMDHLGSHFSMNEDPLMMRTFFSNGHDSEGSHTLQSEVDTHNDVDKPPFKPCKLEPERPLLVEPF